MVAQNVCTRCNITFILRNVRDILVKSVLFYLDRLRRRGDSNLCKFVRYPVYIYDLLLAFHSNYDAITYLLGDMLSVKFSRETFDRYSYTDTRTVLVVH